MFAFNPMHFRTLEFLAVDRFPTGAILICEIAPLNHELRKVFRLPQDYS